MITNIFVIDGDTRRRASISHCFEGDEFHFEPFEDAAELVRHWPAAGILLVFDAENSFDELVDHMTSTGAWLPIIGYSENPRPAQVVKAMHSGAINYVGWPFVREEFALAVDMVTKFGSSIGNLKIREARARSKINQLTRRERQVLEAVAGGLPNRLIGEQLCISPRTVEIHRANMLSKMGVSHSSEAIRIALESALVA